MSTGPCCALQMCIQICVYIHTGYTCSTCILYADINVVHEYISKEWQKPPCSDIMQLYIRARLSFVIDSLCLMGSRTRWALNLMMGLHFLLSGVKNNHLHPDCRLCVIYIIYAMYDMCSYHPILLLLYLVHAHLLLCATHYVHTHRPLLELRQSSEQQQ